MRTTDEAINHTVFPVTGVASDEPLITEPALIMIGASYQEEYGISGYRLPIPNTAIRLFIRYDQQGCCEVSIRQKFVAVVLPHIKTMPQFVNLYNALKGTK